VTVHVARPAGDQAAGAIRAGGLISCRAATSATDLASCRQIRHAVFVAEQALFDESDHDVHDEDPDTIQLLGSYDGLPAGAVRLFALDRASGLWQGDRLCVLPPYRVHGVGMPLVRCAVATAGALGGDRMVAHIQLPNVAFFRHLGWWLDGAPEVYVGQPHQPMSIDLPSPDAGARTARELAAGVR
jgi:putative N-acetyltransferase (TIGR04045 family)